MKAQILWKCGLWVDYTVDHFEVGHNGTLMLFGGDGKMILAVHAGEWRSCRDANLEGEDPA